MAGISGTCQLAKSVLNWYAGQQQRRPQAAGSSLLDGLIAAAGLTPRQALRVRGTDAEERGLISADDATILDAMASHSAYVERPFVETDKGVRLCRPQDKVHEIL